MSKTSGVKFVKGSHNWGRWFIPVKFETESNYTLPNGESIDSICSDGIHFETIQYNTSHPPDEESIISWDVGGSFSLSCVLVCLCVCVCVCVF